MNELPAKIAPVSPIVREKAEIIFSEIKKANKILLHCHPSPDCDSLGSVLAMKSVLEKINKDVTAISGDSKLTQELLFLPGAEKVLAKNISEIDITNFDLFIILDSASPVMISRIKTPVFPLPIRSIVIDHHASNTGFADINLIDPDSRATAFTLYELFLSWGIEISHDVAVNLYCGLYTDTGGFRYSGTTYEMIEAGAQLAKVAPDFNEYIFKIGNYESREYITFLGEALKNIEVFYDGGLVMTSVDYKFLQKNNIKEEDTSGHSVSTEMKKVKGWNIIVTLIEFEPNKIKVGFRTRDEKNTDISQLAIAVGGGGHKAASGAIMNTDIESAKKIILEKSAGIWGFEVDPRG